MYKLIKIILASFFCMLICRAWAEQDAKQIELQVKPKDCVVLEQGDICYVKVKLTWSSTIADSYCLYRSPGLVKLTCWDNANEGRFKEKLGIKSDITYSIVLKANDNVLSASNIIVSWVYEKHDRPIQRWRLF